MQGDQELLDYTTTLENALTDANKMIWLATKKAGGVVRISLEDLAAFNVETDVLERTDDHGAVIFSTKQAEAAHG